MRGRRFRREEVAVACTVAFPTARSSPTWPLHPGPPESRQTGIGQFAPMAVIPPIGVGSQQRTVLGHAARAAVGGKPSLAQAASMTPGCQKPTSMGLDGL